MSLRSYSPAIKCLLALPLSLSAQQSFADAQGSAMATQVAQTGISMGATMFASANMPTCTCSTCANQTQACVFVGIGVAGAMGATAMGLLNKQAGDGLGGDGFNGYGGFDFDDPNFTVNDVLKDPTACLKPEENPAQCKPGGLKETLDNMINTLDSLNKSGKLGSESDKIGQIVDAARSGDYATLAAIADSNPDAAAAMLANVPKSGAGANPDSLGNGDVAFAGTAGEDGGAGDGSGSGKKGNAHIAGSLGAVDWNGLIDMLDSKSGKSLSIWQRATRRYQGGPQGKRAVMMARMELIRKAAIAKMKLAKGPAAKPAMFTEKTASAGDRKPAAIAPQN